MGGGIIACAAAGAASLTPAARRDQVRGPGSGQCVAPIDDLADPPAEIPVEAAKVTDRSATVGRTLRDLDLRAETGASVLAIMRRGEMRANPAPETRLEADDTVVLIGTAEQLGRARATLGRPTAA